MLVHTLEQSTLQSYWKISSEITKMRSQCVVNSLGKQLFVKDINASTGQVDLQTLPTGVYFVKINTEEGQVVKKLVLD